MVPKEDLKKVVLLGYLTDTMLDKVAPIVDLLTFDEGEFVFKQGVFPDRFYMLKRGKILLELRISDKVTVTVGAIEQGFAFGWSAMLDEGAYTTNAVCAEPCEVFSLGREKLLSLLENDHTIGYRMSQRLLRVLKKRLDIRTEQFVRLLKAHPDMKTLFIE